MNMKKIILFALTIILFTNFNVISSDKAEMIGSINNIIYVDDSNIIGPWNGTIDYPFQTIQDGVSTAISGDIVFVNTGIYYENIIISKSLTLLGENKHTTIIDGCRNNDTITISSQGVRISNFTITNSSYDAKTEWWKAGIRVICSNNVIKNNIIKDNLLGIFGKQVTNLSIINNTFYNDGVTFYPYDTGYKKRPALLKDHFKHTIENNTINGKPLLYYLDKNDFEVPSNVGQLIAINCTNMRVRNATFSNADFMAILAFCSNCLIENSTFNNNDGELSLLNSNNNIIMFNNMTNNFHGILLDYYSCDNKILYNNFSRNLYCGVICEYFSNKNLIKHNNFFDNNASGASFIKSFRNKWKNNYWNKTRLLPKFIFGRISPKGNLPWFNIDWTPAKKPFKIK